MPVRRQIHKNYGTYFITFIIRNCLPLFEITKSYDAVFKFFDYLHGCNHYVNVYVIMPNHVHMVITFSNTTEGINKIVGDGKRFMSYEIIKRLKDRGEENLLLQLEKFVNKTDLKRGKLHEVFEPSFDWKECDTDKLIEQKLNYIHLNPCVCNPKLANEPIDYEHSSASYYLGGKYIKYDVEHIMKMKDVKFD